VRLLQPADPRGGLRPAQLDREVGALTAAPSVRPLGPRTLRGRFAVLEPFAAAHGAELAAAAADHTFAYFAQPDFAGWNAKAVREIGGNRLAFTVRRRSDGAAVGSTSYFDIAEQDGRVEIGSTWYAQDARGTAINPEAKLLLLANAFEAGYHCVVLRTCSRNARSRAAILKLGAKEDGILRAAVWMPPSPGRPPSLQEGYFRDSVFYSILAAEWPQVRAGLEARLATFLS
jgi:RimJ/RimL family protein N-acetyltransferase